MTVLQEIKLNIYTLRTLRSDESAAYIALVRTSDSSARDTQTETTSAPPESGWTVTTIPLCSPYVKSDGRLSLQTETDRLIG